MEHGRSVTVVEAESASICVLVGVMAPDLTMRVSP